MKKVIKIYWHNVTIAMESIWDNKIKSLLTALGIIFGVAAVISMMAIGNGARQEILRQMELVGVNNIIIAPLSRSDAEDAEKSGVPRKYSHGLHNSDLEAIKSVIPVVEKVSSEIGMDTYLVVNGKHRKTRLMGVDADYFSLFNITLSEGRVFNEYQMNHGMPVCVIGADLRARLFSHVDPLGQYIKCGKVWLKVIGVMKSRGKTSAATNKMGVSNRNDKVYIPSKTMLLRYENRSLITRRILDEGEENKNTPQLDKIIVQVNETEQLNAVAGVLKRMLLRRHSGVEDFEVIIPELLLKQQQRTKDIFNIVLGAIAGISLLVGGIGIMNIMLASVWERVREIGTRQALGATRKDIVVQFLSESVLISMSGGVIGIILGFVMARLIHQVADISTLVSLESVLIAFGVSVAVGVMFGYMPARKASRQDPVESLRN